MADAPDRSTPSTPSFLDGSGEAKALIRALDGTHGALGPVETWPVALTVATSIMLESPQAMCLAWDSQLTLVYNDAYIPFLGARHPDAMGQPLKAVRADVWPDIAPMVSRAMAGQASRLDDLHLVMTRNGYPEDTWWSFSYSPIRNADGSVGGMLDIATETTAKVLAERAQSEERARQLALLEQMPGFVAVLRGPNHVFEYVNQAYVAMAGPRPFIGKSVAELFPDIEGQGYDALLDRVYTTGEPYSAQGLPITFAGDTAPRFLDFLYTPIRDDSGAVTGIFVGGYEVTASYQTQEALRQSEASLRQLNQELEHKVIQRTKARGVNWQVSPDLMGALNAEGYFETSNPAWQSILGWTEEEVASMSIFELLHPDDLETTRIGFQMTQIGQPAIHFPNRYRCKDGSYRWISWVGVPEEGYVYCTGRDITDERAREAELLVAREALRQSQKLEAMGQLTGGVAHDFNNLLTPIIGGLDMLTRRQVGDARERRVIDGALQSAERAKLLVQRLLAFARRQPLQATAVDLTSLAVGMADLIASTTGPNIVVRVNLQDDLPLVQADPNQLEMALLNLAVNARDAMPEGGVLTLSAEVEAVGPDHRTELTPRSYVRLTVSDTGKGMDAETLRRAIEPFFSTKGIGKGTGLGLSMVHGLTSQLGGGMTLQSAPGRGTSVELWLRLAKSRHAPPDLVDDQVMHAADRDLATALLVDDEELVRMSTADMLSDLGYAVVEASSAEQALDLLQNGLHPDVLVTDHLMPGMSGAELTRAARTLQPELPVLVVSGYAETEGLPPTLPRLTKPFRMAELATVLNAVRTVPQN